MEDHPAWNALSSALKLTHHQLNGPRKHGLLSVGVDDVGQLSIITSEGLQACTSFSSIPVLISASTSIMCLA